MPTAETGDPTTFPASFDKPSDGDGPTIKAADVNVAIEALADRTAWLKAHQLTGDGRFDTEYATATSTLASVNTTTLTDRTVRNTTSGLYVFHADVDPPVGEDPGDYFPWLIKPTTGPGMWLLEDWRVPGFVIDVPLFPCGIITLDGPPADDVLTAEFTYGAEPRDSRTPATFVRKGSTFRWQEVAAHTGVHYGTTIDISAAVLPFQGLKIGEATLYLRGVTGHAALPAVMPSFALLVSDIANGTVATMRTDDKMVVDASASTAAYQAHHSITLTTQQNARIGAKAYTAVIADEGDTNAIAGTLYWGLRLGIGAL